MRRFCGTISAYRLLPRSNHSDADEACPTARFRHACAAALGAVRIGAAVHPARPDRARSVEERRCRRLRHHVDHGARRTERLAVAACARAQDVGRFPAGLLGRGAVHQAVRLAAGRRAGGAGGDRRLLPARLAVGLVRHLSARPARRSAAADPGLRRPAGIEGLRPHPGRWRLPDLSRLSRPAVAQPRSERHGLAGVAGGVRHVCGGAPVRSRHIAQCGLARPRLRLAGADARLGGAAGAVAGPSGAGGDPPAQHPVFAAAGDGAAGLRAGRRLAVRQSPAAAVRRHAVQGLDALEHAPAGLAFMGRLVLSVEIRDLVRLAGLAVRRLGGVCLASAARGCCTFRCR